MSYDNLQEKNEQILNDISQLQDIEKTIYNQLSKQDLSIDEREALIMKIEQISQMRMNLYQTLSNITSFYTNNLNSSSDTLGQQTQALKIVEEQLNNSKKKLGYINGQKINKMRMVEINNYYTAWYDERVKLLKYIIVIVLAILILLLLKKKDILPENSNIFGILLIVVLLIGLYFIIPIILSMITRNNMNYSEFDWSFYKNNAPVISGDATKNKSNPWTKVSKPQKTCVGEQCCPKGTKYEKLLNECVVENAIAVAYNS